MGGFRHETGQAEAMPPWSPGVRFRASAVAWAQGLQSRLWWPRNPHAIPTHRTQTGSQTRARRAQHRLQNGRSWVQLLPLVPICRGTRPARVDRRAEARTSVRAKRAKCGHLFPIGRVSPHGLPDASRSPQRTLTDAADAWRRTRRISTEASHAQQRPGLMPALIADLSTKPET